MPQVMSGKLWAMPSRQQAETQGHSPTGHHFLVGVALSADAPGTAMSVWRNDLALNEHLLLEPLSSLFLLPL